MNNILTEQELIKLAKTHDQHCVSIYLPELKTGEEEKKRILLKNNLKIIKSVLQAYGLNKFEIDEYLSPVNSMLEETNFWKDRLNGMAIFLRNAELKLFNLPYDPAEYNYISDHFYLKPLFSLFNSNQKFYILALSLQKVKLYEADLVKINEVKLNAKIPLSIEGITWKNEKEKSLQFRTGGSKVIYHGHGAGKDDKEKETAKFFTLIDHGIIDQISEKGYPLILACVDKHHSLYADISNYDRLLEKHISGNHDESGLNRLYKLALPIIKDYLKSKLDKKIEHFNSALLTDRVSIDLNEVIPAAFNGRVQYLFLNNQKEKYGLYDTVNRTLIVEEEWKTGHASLFNMAAVQTWLNGGEVYTVDAENMPVSGSGVNALFRY